MSNNSWMCNKHGKQISNICIGNHNCEEKKLCVDCILDNHQEVDKQKMPTTEEFLNQLNNKVQQFKENDFKGLFQTIERIQSKINSEFENTKKQIQSVIEMLSLGDKPILELKDQLSKSQLVEFTNEDFNYMEDILEGNILEQRIYWRKKCQEICLIQLKGLQDQSQLLLDQFEMIKSKPTCEQLERNLKLKGQVILGVKQGDFYYVFDDGSTDWAGNYELGVKQGAWNDCLGYCQTKNELILNRVKYLNGVNLGKDGWPLGQFDQDFQKIGQWQEVGGVWNQLIVKGNYQKGIKVGKWREYYEGNMIGSGDYNNQGQKVGMWTESWSDYKDSLYTREQEITFRGEYRDGIKFGKWCIFYNEENIGGGNYDESGVKIGKWIDIQETLREPSQVTFCGEYKNGIRCGKWQSKYQGKNIGGGTYDEKGVKIGKWTDLHDQFRSYCQVTFTGEYKNGFRIGRWVARFEKGPGNVANIKYRCGGGTYDEKGVKIGQWIDLYENFAESAEVTFCGEYKNGVRTGEWSIKNEGKNIGGGIYDEKGYKVGPWTDLADKFNKFSKITFFGEYINGIRIGKWETRLEEASIREQHVQSLCGGGTYDEKGVKIGEWTDIHQNVDPQPTFCGEYRDGVRFGKWEIRNEGKSIGGGTYNDQGVKIGKWIDLHEEFMNSQQITFCGEYRNGIRIDQWQIMLEGKKIGGGTYNEKGIKIGQWTELNENFAHNCQVTLCGQYRKGIRFGKWSIICDENYLGGGSYDDNGVKIGLWTDLYEKFSNYYQVTLCGQYRKGIRFGKWSILCEGKAIGGGTYDEKGFKIGEWTDLYEKFSRASHITFCGEYRDGFRYGKWSSIYEGKNIGGGTYDENGEKIGQWIDVHESFSYYPQPTLQGEYRNGQRIGEWKKIERNEVVLFKQY